MSRNSNHTDRNRIDIIQATPPGHIYSSDIKKLLEQLTSHKVTFTEQDYKNIITSRNCRLYLAVDHAENRKIAGMVALVQFKVPTGKHARIEDLVVDKNYRGRGIGEKLMRTAISSVKNSGVTHIELTSHAQRVAANKLYKKLGFKLIHTNVYRLY
jgi:ribosomal protein S18 acetylase RimI-like enzyme